jgi:hypothetical protein
MDIGVEHKHERSTEAIGPSGYRARRRAGGRHATDEKNVQVSTLSLLFGLAPCSRLLSPVLCHLTYTAMSSSSTKQKTAIVVGTCWGQGTEMAQDADSTTYLL